MMGSRAREFLHPDDQNPALPPARGSLFYPGDPRPGLAAPRSPAEAERRVRDLRFVVAPMMGVTHHAFRHLLRLLSRRACLMTEMIVARAILERGADPYVRHDQGQSPLLLQLGTRDPGEAALAAERACRIVDYDGININVGCPSHRVHGGGFGACLMADPHRVGEIVRAVSDATGRPVSVKCRLGLDHDPAEESLDRFVEILRAAGVSSLMVHARNAWLKGLDPRSNRRVPPLRWERVFRLKERFPDLPLILNGGIPDLACGRTLLEKTDGIMLGRAVDAFPMLLASVDALVYGEVSPPPEEHEILARYFLYVQERAEEGVPPSRLLDPILRLGHGRPGARRWRQSVSSEVSRLGPRPGRDAWRDALERLKDLFPSPGSASEGGRADADLGPVSGAGVLEQACHAPVRV